jgi:hypothetical protein
MLIEPPNVLARGRWHLTRRDVDADVPTGTADCLVTWRWDPNAGQWIVQERFDRLGNETLVHGVVSSSMGWRLAGEVRP